MTNSCYKQLQFICILSMAASVGLTGCKGFSGLKMPKMSWNREPSATTLAGSETPKLPESPANKYSPSTIASVGAGTSPGTSPGNKAKTYGYAGQSPSATSAASPGLAATANGFQSQPYTFGQKASSPQSNTSPAGAVANSLPNPYGGSYNGLNAAGDTGTKSSFAGYTAGPSAPSIPGSTQSPYGSAPYGVTPQGSASAYSSGVSALPPLPNALQSSVAAPSNTYQSLPPLPGAMPSAPSNSLPTLGANSGTVGAQGYGLTAPGISQTTQSVAAPTTTAPNSYGMDAPSANRYSGVYQPGTTGRNTSYNFGGAQPTTASATGPATSLPPNTASGAGPGLPYGSTLR